MCSFLKLTPGKICENAIQHVVHGKCGVTSRFGKPWAGDCNPDLFQRLPGYPYFWGELRS